jgi:prepilin-type N-terminal cleavage/methylation domain-containing protein
VQQRLGPPRDRAIDRATDPATDRATDRDRGFTLVEILVVVVVLGVIATATVLSVQGVTDRGRDSAVEADRITLENAQESYWAKNGSYATESELVSGGLLRTESRIHDVVIEADGSYTIVLATAATPTTVP